MIKISYNPKTDKCFVSSDGQSHAEQIRNPKIYDSFVRALYFPEKHVLYFRFHCPSWDYIDYPNEEQRDFSFKKCEKALSYLLEAHLIPKKTKILYWQIGHGVSEFDVRF